MKQKEYPIKTGREIVNSILHIIIGGVIAYVILPTSTFIISMSVAGGVAIIREVLQRLRGKKQPMYIHIIDVAGFIFGAAIWVYVRDKKKIKPDEL